MYLEGYILDSCFLGSTLSALHSSYLLIKVLRYNSSMVVTSGPSQAVCCHPQPTLAYKADISAKRDPKKDMITGDGDILTVWLVTNPNRECCKPEGVCLFVLPLFICSIYLWSKFWFPFPSSIPVGLSYDETSVFFFLPIILLNSNWFKYFWFSKFLMVKCFRHHSLLITRKKAFLYF